MPNTFKRELIHQPEQPLHFQRICKQRLRTPPGLLT